MQDELGTSLKRQAIKIIVELHDTKEPALITEHGKPSTYLVDVDEQNRLAILEGLARGERAIFEGKVLSHDEAKNKMSKWLK